jgi:DNA-binding FadR family transcriptional regulator
MYLFINDSKKRFLSVYDFHQIIFFISENSHIRPCVNICLIIYYSYFCFTVSGNSNND